jgi:hypothetical protein
VDYTSKTNALILLDMGHMLRGERVYRRNRDREGNPKLESG